jgi:prepilin-type N-terminal cleavage/methylation domain-containing protein
MLAAAYRPEVPMHIRSSIARSRQGFTLIELLIVVTIIGVLAALAIPAFNHYVQRSRMSDGFAMLGEIRQREEAYRAEFGEYVTADWYPSVTPGTVTSVTPWAPPPGSPWIQLGAAPDGPTRFVYRVNAGAPGMTPDNCPAGLGAVDFSFCAHAAVNLDGDGVSACLETTSVQHQVFIGRGGANCGAFPTDPLPQGWE